NRIPKVPEDATIKLGAVAPNVLGVSSRLMIEAIIRGAYDPVKLAERPARRALKTLCGLPPLHPGAFRDKIARGGGWPALPICSPSPRQHPTSAGRGLPTAFGGGRPPTAASPHHYEVGPGPEDDPGNDKGPEERAATRFRGRVSDDVGRGTPAVGLAAVAVSDGAGGRRLSRGRHRDARALLALRLAHPRCRPRDGARVPLGVAGCLPRGSGVRPGR